MKQQIRQLDSGFLRTIDDYWLFQDLLLAPRVYYQQYSWK